MLKLSASVSVIDVSVTTFSGSVATTPSNVADTFTASWAMPVTMPAAPSEFPTVATVAGDALQIAEAVIS